MPLLKDATPMVKELRPPPPVPLCWFLPSLFAAFNVVLLVIFSGLFFAFPWLAQHGNWAFPTVTGLLFALTFFSLITLNFSDPGILHRGSGEQSPMTVHVVWVNHRAFRLQWCPKCCFHRPPRTYHCPWCNICVEDFDHHCKWVNNCVGNRNFRFFMLLVLSLCLYSGSLLVTCLLFLLRTSHLPFCIDKAMAILVAVPAAGFLVLHFLLLTIQVLSVSAAERSYEGKPFGPPWPPAPTLLLPQTRAGPSGEWRGRSCPGAPRRPGAAPAAGSPQARLGPSFAPPHPAMPGAPASQHHLLRLSEPRPCPSPHLLKSLRLPPPAGCLAVPLCCVRGSGIGGVGARASWEGRDGIRENPSPNPILPGYVTCGTS
ncbi:palmitoyltransferase ZDHHC19 isoform X2 [Oryctolagus cuniculus]|uniref:palmitoyltransferase ZDHHC19 isoform X2 n=1 Tax=Oryctolagus cuniculus TaxID=9986 RepID=UPI00387A4CF2